MFIAETNFEIPIMVRYDMAPDGTIDIISIGIYGVDLTNSQADSFIRDYGEDALKEMCFDSNKELNDV